MQWAPTARGGIGAAANRVAAGQMADQLPLMILVGNSSHANNDPLVVSLVRLICIAYEESVSSLYASGNSDHDRIDAVEVKNRLIAGDDPRENRVLHLAFRGNTLVGCISSAWRAPITLR